MVRNQVAHLSIEGDVEGYSGADGETRLRQRIGPTLFFFQSIDEERKIDDVPTLMVARMYIVNGISSLTFQNLMSGQVLPLKLRYQHSACGGLICILHSNRLLKGNRCLMESLVFCMI